MSKIFDDAIEREEKRLEGEEQFINEPKSVAETNTGIDWKNSQDTDWESISEKSQRALNQLDHNINRNPLD